MAAGRDRATGEYARKEQRLRFRLAILALAASACAAILAQARRDTAPLPTGRTISPEGTQTDAGSFPANMVLSPDGKYVIATNTGFRQYLSVLSTDDGRLISQVEIPRSDKKEG